VSAHFPPLHTSPAAHLTPHPPQLPVSVAVDTHAPLQFVSEVGHPAAHAPPTHTCAPGQALPQPPQ
jgi:hypothetical protein